MNRNTIERIVYDKLDRLGEIAAELAAHQKKSKYQIRVKEIELLRTIDSVIIWPRRDKNIDFDVKLSGIDIEIFFPPEAHTYKLDRDLSIAGILHRGRFGCVMDMLGSCEYKPKAVTYLCHKLEEAISWCEDRLLGLKRHEIEIAKQQSKYTRKLESEAIMLALCHKL